MKRRCTVAMVSDAIQPFHYGGKELRYYELAQRLAKHADVHVYTMHWWTGPRVVATNGVTLHAISPQMKLYTKDRRSIVQAVVFAIGCLRLLGQRFDVLEADQVPYLHVFTLRLVATLKRKRFVVTWYEVWGRSYWLHYLGRVGLAAWWIERLAMRLPDHIIAASPETGRRIRAELGERARVTVAPGGIDLDVVNRAVRASPTTDLVVVGRLMAHKRIDMLLDAIALLHAKGAPVTCRIIGDGPELANLQQQTANLGLVNAVKFLLDVEDRTEVYSLLKAAGAFVFPSAREGFGIAALEALACGTPVVTTSASDNLARFLVAQSDNGIVCEPSAQALAASIELLLGRPAAYGGRPVDPWLREYGWEAVANRVAGVLLVDMITATLPSPDTAL
jgi:glycosyltransferase involved in cell wall biosynthesis